MDNHHYILLLGIIHNQSVIKFLVDKCPTMVNLKINHSGITLLHILCQENKVDTLKFFINGYPSGFFDFNAVDHAGMTPLYHAANKGHTEIVNILLENSEKIMLDIHKKTQDGKTALDIAKSQGHQNVAVLLQKYLK